MSQSPRLGVPVVVAAALASCASYDPALVERIEEVWDQPAAETVYPNGELQPWRVGQWVRMRIDDHGTRGVRTVLVAREEGSAHWIELHDVWPDRETTAALLVEGYCPGDSRSTRILRVRLSRADGEVLEVDVGSEQAAAARETRTQVEYLLDLLDLRRSSGRVEDVAVPAGTFQNVFETPFVVTAGRETWRGVTWYTNAVPVTGWARVEARTPYLLLLQWRRSLQVVAFGEAGVTSRFFGE